MSFVGSECKPHLEGSCQTGDKVEQPRLGQTSSCQCVVCLGAPHQLRKSLTLIGAVAGQQLCRCSRNFMENGSLQYF